MKFWRNETCSVDWPPLPHPSQIIVNPEASGPNFGSAAAAYRMESLNWPRQQKSFSVKVHIGNNTANGALQRTAGLHVELQWVWNGAHSALVRINEELLE
jgi:hypothetical protein